jgi:hypothetical protein
MNFSKRLKPRQRGNREVVGVGSASLCAEVLESSAHDIVAAPPATAAAVERRNRRRVKRFVFMFDAIAIQARLTHSRSGFDHNNNLPAQRVFAFNTKGSNNP